MVEKETLVKEVDKVLVKDDSINLSLIVVVAISIMIVMFLFIPKIYLSNSIYKESLKINHLKVQYYSLLNENKILKEKIEKLKFKNGVTH